MTVDEGDAGEPFCYLTTTGRVSGEPRTVELWFALEGRTLYVLAGGRDRTGWVRNLRREPRVTVRLRGRLLSGQARVVPPGEPADDLARRLLVAKYGRDGDLTGWGRTALPVAVELDPG